MCHSVVIVLGNCTREIVEKALADLPAPHTFSLIKYVSNVMEGVDASVHSPTERERVFASNLVSEYVNNIRDVEAIVYELGLGDGAALGLRPRYVREAVHERQRRYGSPLASIFAVSDNYIQRRW